MCIFACVSVFLSVSLLSLYASVFPIVFKAVVVVGLRQLDERTLVKKLDGRRSAGLGYGGVAGREAAR